jgi:hypothetical protein
VKDIKVGDVVHVRGFVESGGTGYDRSVTRVRFADDARYPSTYVPTASVAHVEPRQIQVGDTVTWGTRFNNFIVCSIDGDEATVRPEGSQYIMPVSKLERVE